MRLLLITFTCIILSGCAVKNRQLRLIYVQDNSKTEYYNLKGEKCILTAEDVDPKVYDGDSYPKEVKIIETYKNCDFHKVRILEEREKLMWGIDYRRIERERLDRKRKGLPQ